jgi:hypothetical protein
MAIVTKDAGPAPDGAGGSQQGTAPQKPRQAGRYLRNFLHSPIFFGIALVAAIVPRIVAMLGFGPALLFRMDSFDYLWGASHLSPNVINPSGYSLFLWLLRPFHSLVLVVALQHLMGLGVGVLVYAVLRRHGLPAWGATLAATPVLFDPSEIMIEQMVMADLLAMVLVVAAFALLLGTSLPLWRLTLAGLLMGISVIVRPVALPIVVLIPVYLLIQRVGWRRALTALVAGIVPVTAYMGWFDSTHGSFNLTNSNGLFLWTRTMSFAECGVIKPPADLRALCPGKQPGALSESVPSKRPLPKYYLWNRLTWQWQPPSDQFVPDTAAFTRAKNARALRFALDAIKAQPVAYAGVVLKESLEPFVQLSNLRFPAGEYGERSTPLTHGNFAYASAAVGDYTAEAAGVPQIRHHRYATELTQPYVYWMNKYQRHIFLPGPLLGLILLVGLAGIVIPGRRLQVALLWVSAVIIMMLSVAEHEYTYRYVIAGVPLLCMAAALALTSIVQAATRARAVDLGGTAPAVSAS